jgi:hypothetical protein
MPKVTIQRAGEDAMSVPTGKKRAGLKPGQRHGGQFKLGHDPRRHLGGPTTPTIKKAFKAAIRELEEGAIALLEECITDPSAPYRERRAAAELVLNHSQGMPVNRVLMAEVDGVGAALDSLSMDDIHQRLRLIHQQKELEVHTYEER